MQTEEFVERVAAQCPDLDPARAHDICVITIAALSEHISREQARRLASQLPRELTEAVEVGGKAVRNPGNRVSLDAFHDQIVNRAEVDHTTAQQVARAVAQTLAKAVSDSEAVAVTFDLPEELDGLLASQM